MADSYNIHQIIKLRDKIAEGMVGHVGTCPEGLEFDKLVDDLYLLLPENIKYPTVKESTSYLLGKELTINDIKELGWRLAGNMEKLKNDQIVYPWTGQSESEWMPVQILAADRTKTWKGEAGYQFKIRILAGSACPLVFYKTWPAKAVSFIARKIGFSASWKNMPYRDGHELVSMRFMVEIDPKMCKDQKPGFHNISCTGGFERWNKDILQARSHINPPCPYNFTHFCYQCPVGYDQCKAGTHPKTYELKPCSVCDDETWHDPGYNNVCVVCRDRLRREQ